MKGSGQSDKDLCNQTMYKGSGEGRGAAEEGWKGKVKYQSSRSAKVTFVVMP